MLDGEWLPDRLSLRLALAGEKPVTFTGLTGVPY